MKRKYQLLVAGMLALLAFWWGYDMLDRAGRGLLWGYRPLGLFLSVYFCLVALAAPWLAPDSRRYRWLGLALAGGVLLSLGFPDTGIPFPLFMFVGFVPLLQLERELAAARPRLGGRTYFRYVYLALVLWNILTTYWVANTALVAGLFAILANALLMAVPLLLFHYTRRVLPRLAYVAFVAYWLSFEYIHLNWELTWPWLTLGNSLAEYPALIQWYSFTGVFGGGSWILLGNVLAFRLWRRYARGDLTAAHWLRMGAFLLLPAALSLFLFFTYEAPAQGAIEVVVVQPDYEPHYEKFTTPEGEQAARYIELSREKLRPQTDYLLFPETSFGYMRTDRVLDYPAIRQVGQMLEDYPQTYLVSGLSAYEVRPPGGPLTSATRRQTNAQGDTTYFEVLNAAAQLSPGGESVQWYRKSRLVPGPEIFPYRSLLWFLGPLVERLQGTWEGVGTQERRSVFNSPKARVGPVICYESVFGDYYADYVREGAQAMFIMTNDGWWDNTAGHRQHLHFASLRAIETRRGIARSANTGISAFIDQRGIIRQATAYEEAAVIRDTIRLNDATTFYVAWGDMLARLALFASAILLLNALVRGLIRRDKKGALKGS